MPVKQMQREQRFHGYIQKNVALASGSHEVMIPLKDKKPAGVGMGNLDIKGECVCHRFGGSLAVTRLKSSGITTEFVIK